MSLVDMYRRDVARILENGANLQKDLHRHESDAQRAADNARREAEQAQRASNPTSYSSRMAAASREQKKATDAGKRAAAVAKQIASNVGALATKRRSLESAEKSAQQAADRDTQRRRDKEKQHARDVARLFQSTVRHVHIHPSEPEMLRVLYLTANSGSDLRTEAEVRLVQQALRGAKYRDQIKVEIRPAATFEDLTDGLNDVRPHIIHFSGHGGGGTLAFEDGSLTNPADHVVSSDLLMKALRATDHPPTLLVLNACDTLAQTESILSAVSVLIAMSDAIPDLSAAVFAQKFYAALASGQSVGSALEQARVMIEALSGPGASELPQALAREGIDLEALILVKPQASN